MSSGPVRPRRPGDLMAAAVNRSWRLPPRRNAITVERSVRVPMRDGTVLLADHYAPLPGEGCPTVLMRCPYGRSWQFGMMARPLAERGYHVLLQSVRGTFGSGGTFTPAINEPADGQDTVAWLRGQDWFDGRLATFGASYLAYVQWALALDPPPELKAMAVHISPHDLAAAGIGHGAFELFNLLMWSELMANQERVGVLRGTWRLYRVDRRLASAFGRLPLAATAEAIGGDGAPWYSEWMDHPELADPYWDGYRATAALDTVTAPTLLITGAHDFFVEQTLRQYQALRDRGVPARLVIGPWTHMTLDMGLAIKETLAWFDAAIDRNGPGLPHRGPSAQPVRVWTSGLGRWHDLPGWPPPEAQPQAWYLHPGGSLADQEPAEAAGPAAGRATTFRYDPRHPTPSVGGRTMSMATGGGRDNRALEARDDVLTFSTPPLSQPAEVAGAPVVRLFVSSDNPYCDIFARLCDVDERGRSRNLTDQITRLSADGARPGEVREVSLRLTDISHRFLPGHKIRLQISGGAHPRFARNLGTAENPVTSTAMEPVTHHVRHCREHPSAIIMPVLRAGRPEPATSAGEAASGGFVVVADGAAIGSASALPGRKNG
jgi:uncharacterized protein